MKENQNIEFKSSWHDDYLKWICGFANAQGGTIFIGKDDDGKVVGIDNAERLLEEIPNKVRDLLGIMVDVNLLKEQKNKYLEIIVEPYPYPVNYKGQFFYRTGSTKQELKGNALNKFILKKAGKHWDGIPLLSLRFKDLDKSAFDLFRKKAKKAKRIDTDVLIEKNESLLTNLRLYENNQLKRAAALLFHSDPEKFFIGAYIKIGFFESDADILYQDEIHGNLFEQVDKTMDLLLTKYMKAFISYERITRVETYPVPEVALREALINAVAHKDYSSGIPIQISVYDDKIYIWNDGQLPVEWSLDQLLSKHASMPYNPDVANTFFRAGMIEAWGRGISKIIDTCNTAGLQTPIFRTDFGGLQIKFLFKEKDSLRSALKSSPKNSVKTSDKIIEIIKNNNDITIPEMAEIIGISVKAIEKQIGILKKSGTIKREGSNKKGRWVIVVKTQ